MSAIRARDDTWTRLYDSPGRRRHGIFRRKAALFRASPAATVGTLLLVAAVAASGRGFGVASGSAADPSHAASSFKFMVIGDWGTGDMNQMRTARGMMDVIGDDGTFNMVLSTGDQMYPSGAKHVADEQFDTKFEEQEKDIKEAHMAEGTKRKIKKRRNQETEKMLDVQTNCFYQVSYRELCCV